MLDALQPENLLLFCIVVIELGLAVAAASEQVCWIFLLIVEVNEKYLSRMRVKYFMFVWALLKVCFVVQMVEFPSIPARRWSIDRSTKATCARALKGAQSSLLSNKCLLILLLRSLPGSSTTFFPKKQKATACEQLSAENNPKLHT